MDPVPVDIAPPAGWEPVVFGKGQPEYLPLPALVHQDGRMVARWTFTAEERAAIAAGADLFLTVHTFNSMLQPLLPTVGGAYVDEWHSTHAATPSPVAAVPSNPPPAPPEEEREARPGVAVVPVNMLLESTDDVAVPPGPSRVWQGFTEEGAEVTALITLIAKETGDLAYDAHLRRALETRIPSQAVITIPVEASLIEIATEIPR